MIWNKKSFLTKVDQCCAHPAGNPAEFQDSSDHHTFKKMLPRDERRFKASDLDGDLTATREEFTAFLHPEEFEHMKEIVVLVRTVKMQTGQGPGRKLSPHLVPSSQRETRGFSLLGIGEGPKLNMSSLCPGSSQDKLAAVTNTPAETINTTQACLC